ncbi:O-antigen ligase family protein [Granulosicoccus sp.]|nr:O-antigen ligase family protein [Granulosicoccus sp.]
MPLTALTFLLVYLVGLIASVVASSAWPFLTYQAVYFANPTGRWWAYSVPSLPYSTITVLLLALHFFFRDRSPEQQSSVLAVPQTKYIAVHLLIMTAVTPIAVDPVAHAKILGEFSKLCLTILLAFSVICTFRRLLHSVWAYLGGCFYISWEAFTVGRSNNGRVEGIGPVDALESNGTAAVLAPAPAMIMVFLVTGSRAQRIIAAVFGGWIVNALVLVNSRGAFLAVLGGCSYVVYHLLFSRVQQERQRLLVVFLVGVALIGAYSLTDEEFWLRMNTLQALDNPEKESSRVHFWMAAVDLAKDYPFGAGADGFQAMSRIYIPPEHFNGDGERRAVHSTWFQALAETGWLGLLTMILLTLSCFRSGRRARRYALDTENHEMFWTTVAVEGAFISFLITATFINRYHAEILYWLILYLACLHALVPSVENQKLESQ